MPTLKRVILNGTDFFPTTIDKEDLRITSAKSPIRMLDGTLRLWHRAFKRRWVLHWNSVSETIVPAIRSTYRLTTSFTYNDEDNVNHTVVSTAFSENLSAERISRAGIIFYDVDLTIEEV